MDPHPFSYLSVWIDSKPIVRDSSVVVTITGLASSQNNLVSSNKRTQIVLIHFNKKRFTSYQVCQVFQNVCMPIHKKKYLDWYKHKQIFNLKTVFE